MSCQISANPDAAGIGVRAAFYVQAAISLVSAARHIVNKAEPDEAEKANPEEVVSDLVQGGVSVLATGVALTISAFVQAKDKNDGLSAYHALIILHLGWIMIFTAIVPYSTALTKIYALDKHDRHAVERKLTVMLAVYYITLTLLGIFGLWVFAEPQIFSGNVGSDEGKCGSTTVFWWWGDYPKWTSARFRSFWMAIYIISIIPVVNILALFLLMAPFLLLFAFLSESGGSSQRGMILAYTVPLVSVIINALIITSIEKSISANHVEPGEDSWSLGQTFALLAAVFPAFDLLSKLYDDYKEWRGEELGEDMSVLESPSAIPQEIAAPLATA